MMAMFVSREREKLENAAIFFVQKTKHCHTLKLLKLLNFLDFEHFRQTGRTVTGLSYEAWEMGPVARDVWEELQSGSLGAALIADAQKDHITNKVIRRSLRAKRQFKKAIFTKRELAIMERIAEIFSELQANDMSEFSHLRGNPWRKIYNKGKGRGAKIPEELALEADPLMYEKETIDTEEMEFRRALLG